MYIYIYVYVYIYYIYMYMLTYLFGFPSFRNYGKKMSHIDLCCRETCSLRMGWGVNQGCSRR